MIVINPAGSDDTSSGLLGQKPGENRFGMLPRERGDVEPGTAGGLHYLLPQYSHQHRTDQTEDMEPRIAGADLSPLLGPFDNGREHLDRPASDLIVPNLRQLGKVARLPDHHLGDRADRHCASHCGEARQKDPENLIDREIGRHCGGPDGLDIRENRIGDHCPEQLLLVGEIEVERSFRDAGPPGDFVEPGRREPPLGKNLKGRRADFRGTFSGSPLPAWMLHDAVLEDRAVAHNKADEVEVQGQARKIAKEEGDRRAAFERLRTDARPWSAGPG